MNKSNISAHRGAIFHFQDPSSVQGGGSEVEGSSQGRAVDNEAIKEVKDDPPFEYFEDGVLIVVDGKIDYVGDLLGAQNRLDRYGHAIPIIHHPNAIIMPGFVDTHVHYPQTEIVCSYGEQLLQWLHNYTFPIEERFSDREYAKRVAEQFCNLLLDFGTTTCMTFSTSHPQSVDAIFSAAQRRQMRMITGKVMMDRNASDRLCQPAQQCAKDTLKLIEKWHGNGRLSYALTPRFAPTSSNDQLALVGKLMAEDHSLLMQTHLAENRHELKWVSELYPHAKNYLDVYDQHGLVSDRSIFAHAIHLSEPEWRRLSETEAKIAFCPSSNLFLGSGLFDYTTSKQQSIDVGLGTDVGAGSSLSMFQTFKSAYETQQLNGVSLSPLKLLYMATLGGAKVLGLDHCIGNFSVGKEADFVVLDLLKPEMLKIRCANSSDLMERLFALALLADDRTVKETYIMGQSVSALS